MGVIGLSKTKGTLVEKGSVFKQKPVLCWEPHIPGSFLKGQCTSPEGSHFKNWGEEQFLPICFPNYMGQQGAKSRKSRNCLESKDESHSKHLKMVLVWICREYWDF